MQTKWTSSAIHPTGNIRTILLYKTTVAVIHGHLSLVHRPGGDMTRSLAGYVVFWIMLPVALSAPVNRDDNGTFVEVDLAYEGDNYGEVSGLPLFVDNQSKCLHPDLACINFAP